MKLSFRLILINSLAFLWGCDYFISEQSLVGTYTFSKTEFSFDTLVVHENGTYEQRIFSKHLKQLITNKDTWTYKEGRIIFQNFIPNDNQEFKAHSYKDIRITSSMPVYYCGMEICIESFGDLNYYYVKN